MVRHHGSSRRCVGRAFAWAFTLPGVRQRLQPLWLAQRARTTPVHALAAAWCDDRAGRLARAPLRGLRHRGAAAVRHVWGMQGHGGLSALQGQLQRSLREELRSVLRCRELQLQAQQLDQQAWGSGHWSSGRIVARPVSPQYGKWLADDTTFRCPPNGARGAPVQWSRAPADGSRGQPQLKTAGGPSSWSCRQAGPEQC